MQHPFLPLATLPLSSLRRTRTPCTNLCDSLYSSSSSTCRRTKRCTHPFGRDSTCACTTYSSCHVATGYPWQYLSQTKFCNLSTTSTPQQPRPQITQPPNQHPLISQQVNHQTMQAAFHQALRNPAKEHVPVPRQQPISPPLPLPINNK